MLVTWCPPWGSSGGTPVASTAAIDSCSWRHHERSLRCRRLMAAPSRSAMADRWSFHEKKRACVRLLSCETPGGGGSGGFDVRLDECVCPYPPVDAPDHGGHVPVDMAPPVLHLCAGLQKKKKHLSSSRPCRWTRLRNLNCLCGQLDP